MKELLAVSRQIDRASTALGRSVAWLIVVAAVISATNAVVRKAFDWSSNSLLEVQWWLFAAVFLLAAPWTLAVNEHIRIDVVSSRLSKRGRDFIDLFGNLFFLFPFVAPLLERIVVGEAGSPEGAFEIGARVGAAQIMRTGANFADGIHGLAVFREIDALGQLLEHGELVGIHDELLVSG